MTLKQINLETSINQKATALQTSAKPTETGSEIQLSGERKELALARLMEVESPAEVDTSLLTSLESLTKFPVKEISRTKYTSHGADVILQRYEIHTDSMEVVQQCIRQVQYAMIPMPQEQIVERLAVLAAMLVKPAGESSKDAGIRIKAIAMELKNYPADIVIAAIRDIKNTNKFWPAYSEFHEHIAWRMKRREKLMDCLQKKRVEIAAQMQ